MFTCTKCKTVKRIDSFLASNRDVCKPCLGIKPQKKAKTVVNMPISANLLQDKVGSKRMVSSILSSLPRDTTAN